MKKPRKGAALSKTLTVGFLGAGNMAQALIERLLTSGTLKPNQIVATCPTPARLALLRRKYKIKTVPTNGALLEKAKILMLAVKPKDVAAVGSEIGAKVSARQLLISMVAGVSIARMREVFGHNARLVRTMPNTPALVGEGATGVFMSPGTKPADRTVVRQLLCACGQVEFLPQEAQLNAVTGLSGSGPAYVLMMIEALAEAGEQNGLPPQTALSLSIQTVLGAATLARSSQEHPKELRRRVTSPGGTTVEAIKILEENLFPMIIAKAVTAATRRAEELSRTF